MLEPHPDGVRSIHPHVRGYCGGPEAVTIVPDPGVQGVDHRLRLGLLAETRIRCEHPRLTISCQSDTEREELAVLVEQVLSSVNGRPGHTVQVVLHGLRSGVS